MTAARNLRSPPGDVKRSSTRVKFEKTPYRRPQSLSDFPSGERKTRGYISAENDCRSSDAPITFSLLPCPPLLRARPWPFIKRSLARLGFMRSVVTNHQTFACQAKSVFTGDVFAFLRIVPLLVIVYLLSTFLAAGQVYNRVSGSMCSHSLFNSIAPTERPFYLCSLIRLNSRRFRKKLLSLEAAD